MMSRRGILVAAVLLMACNQGTAPLVPTTASSARIFMGRPDMGDQPSFAERTNRRLPVLSLQELFHPTYVVPNDPAHVRTLLVTGDVIPSRGVNFYATQRRDYLWPFRPTADFVKDADVTFIDLEAPLFVGCPVSAASSFTFCGDPRFVNGLKLMGADVASLANNHTSNYGAEGIRLTDQLLQKNGILSTGLGPVAVIDVRGVKFGFIAFNGVGRAIDKIALKASIQRARQQADIGRASCRERV